MAGEWRLDMFMAAAVLSGTIRESGLLHLSRTTWVGANWKLGCRC